MEDWKLSARDKFGEKGHRTNNAIGFLACTGDRSSTGSASLGKRACQKIQGKQICSRLQSSWWSQPKAGGRPLNSHLLKSRHVQWWGWCFQLFMEHTAMSCSVLAEKLLMSVQTSLCDHIKTLYSKNTLNFSSFDRNKNSQRLYFFVGRLNAAENIKLL